MNKSNRYIGDGKEIWQELEKVGMYSNVFDDWLDLILNSLLALTDNLSRENIIQKFKENKLDGKYNDKYMEIVKKYKNDAEKGKRPMDYFVNAWVLLYKETQEKQKDIIGQIYEQKVSYGEHGQFFTPEHITEAMTKMVEPKEKEKVYDPCCGSGRFLISAFKNNPNVILRGIDIDVRCAKMCVINMFLFDCNSVITWGDSLAMEEWQKWQTGKGGYITEKLLKSY